MKLEHWRKSGQWFALNRKHAQLVVDDVEANESFKKCTPACLAPLCKDSLDPMSCALLGNLLASWRCIQQGCRADRCCHQQFPVVAQNNLACRLDWCKLLTVRHWLIRLL